MKVCSVEGCDKPHRARGYCGRHYYRYRKYGDAGEAESRRRPIGVKEKPCKDCGGVKPASEFYTQKGGHLYSRCKECHYIRTQKWREKNREKINAADRRRYRSGESVIKRNAKRLAKYGLTPERFDALLRDQLWTCAVCRLPFEPTSIGRGTQWQLVIDHDHETAEVRGLLHRHCNLAIEFLLTEDDVRRAREYLNKPPAAAILKELSCEAESSAPAP